MTFKYADRERSRARTRSRRTRWSRAAPARAATCTCSSSQQGDVLALRDVEQHVRRPRLELRLGREVRPLVERAAPRRLDERRRRGAARSCPGLVKVSEVQAGAVDARHPLHDEQHAAGVHPPGDARRRQGRRDAAADGAAPAPQGELRHERRSPGPTLVILTALQAVRPHPRRQRERLVLQRRQRRRAGRR